VRKNNVYKRIKKSGARINSELPESVLNPAIGGVFTMKSDPTEWWTITSIGKDNEGFTGLSIRNSSGQRCSMGRYFYNPASLNDAIIYDYIPAGTPEAKEATRKPVDRLRDILLARKAA
jgi:hypothetical protein